MSLLLNTIKAFPRGRRLEELLILLDCSFDDVKRQRIQGELTELVREGAVFKGRDGKWRPIVQPAIPIRKEGDALNGDKASEIASLTEVQVLTAARADFRSEALPEELDENLYQEDKPDPNALLRYWRAALQADPRGSVTQAEDLHGTSWHLICGSGPVSPQQNHKRKLSIELDALQPEFRQALVRREANEKSFAIGWPLAVGRKSGMPVIWPVGMLVADWQRTETHLEIFISTDEVLINPDWLKGTARATGWSASELSEAFTSNESVGLTTDEFLLRLREAVAGQVRGRIDGEDLLSQLDPQAVGIYDIAGIFLPDNNSFTAGAVRDLDTIASWPRERLERTALAPLLGLRHDLEAPSFPDINTGPMNAEQIRSVRNACSAPLSVVTGPPGTGKSQAIVSMAASVIAAGGSVLVASKNHQALDAIEERLGGMAPSIPFLVRTIDKKNEIDRSMTDVLNELIVRPSVSGGQREDFGTEEVRELSRRRSIAMDAIAKTAEIECQIADLLDKLDARQEKNTTSVDQLVNVTPERVSAIARVWQWVVKFLVDRRHRHLGANSSDVIIDVGMSSKSIHAKLKALRSARSLIDQSECPVEITEKIQSLTSVMLPRVMSARTVLSEATRVAMANQKDDLEFASNNAPLPGDLARSILACRPLWLASILGAPKRLPLDDGLFDLVVFDEASQCDIASSLPLFARAKRAVVVGDNRQLRFIPQLGLAKDRNLMQAQGLPTARMGRYAQSKRSLFDFALRVPDVPRELLRRQYRSAGPIVDYINREFYNGELEVAFDPSNLKVPRSQKPGLAWTDVPGTSFVDKGKVNRKEAKAICDHLSKLLIEESYNGSVAVICLFKNQSVAIAELIRSVIPEQKLAGADFRVATVDGFQGQERDLILFSLCLTDSSAASSKTFLQKDRRRLNVAISRAKAVAHIFGDLEFARSGGIKALVNLAAAATEPAMRSGEGDFDSKWERRVYYALKDRGLKPESQYDIAGRRLDFALFGSGDIKLDLEVDGRRWHQNADGQRKISDIWRDHQIRSMGWRVRRFWVDELNENMEACLDIVEQDLR